MADSNGLLAIHAVKFDINFISSVLFGIKNNCLENGCQEKINEFERSIEDITYHLADKVLSDDKINPLVLFILLEGYSPPLFE